jgi:hypothetical protein
MLHARGYYVVVCGGHDDAVRLSSKVNSDKEAAVDTFGLYAPDRMAIHFISSRVADVQNVRKRTAAITQAREAYASKVKGVLCH